MATVEGVAAGARMGGSPVDGIPILTLLRPGSPSSRNVDEKETGLAARNPIGYRVAMSFLLRNIARYAAQKLAADPRVREAAARAAQAAVDEGKRVAADENRAYAAGQAVGRALHKLRGER